MELNMEKTKYANSHGLMNVDNKSCPFDLVILCEYGLKNALFKKVVNTARYQCVIDTVISEHENPQSPTISNRSTSFSISEQRGNIYSGEQ